MKIKQTHIKKIILFVILFAFGCKSNSQSNKMFEEYLSSTFAKVNPTYDLVLYSTFLDSTKNYEGIGYGNYKFQNFIPKEMGFVGPNTAIYPYFMFTNQIFYFTLFWYVTTDEKVFKNNGAFYYFVIYNKNGEIVNTHKLLGTKDQQWFKDGVNYDSKLFISKNKIKYLLYGPYKLPEKEAKCLEVIYEINNNGSFNILSERSYKAKKVDDWNW